MTFDDVVIGVLCLGLGYWIVSWVMDQMKNGPRSADAFDENNNILTDESRGLENYWHRILGVSSIATIGEIQSAYETLMAKYHPDRCAASGQEERDLAERRIKQINAAYTFAVSKFGKRFFK